MLDSGIRGLWDVYSGVRVHTQTCVHTRQKEAYIYAHVRTQTPPHTPTILDPIYIIDGNVHRDSQRSPPTLSISMGTNKCHLFLAQNAPQSHLPGGH